MVAIFAPKSLGLRRGSAHGSAHDLSDSSSSSRKQSISSGRRESLTSSPMDDWSDGFTGIVDLDRQMRQLAIAEQGLTNLAGPSDLDVYEPYLPSASWAEQAQGRRKSSSDARVASGSQSSTSARSIPPSPLSLAPTTSSGSTAGTSRFSNDSRTHSSLLAKRHSSSALLDSFDGANSPLRLAPLPASPSAFGNYRLTDTAPRRSSGVFVSPSWSSLDEQDPLTPLAIATRDLEPVTPGTAAAATWTDPTAPGYFPAGLASARGKKARSLRKKAARAPLPRLVSGEVVSSPTAELEGEFDGAADGLAGLGFVVPADDMPAAADAQAKASHTIRRSAQSLALSLRFKMLRAKRKVRRTSQEAADLFTAQSSQRSSLDNVVSI